MRKLNCYLTIILSAAVLLILSFNLAQAQWSEINRGYAVTTNWHGKEVPIGQSVTAWAGTTNSSVYQVEFKWKNETGYVVYAAIVTKENMVKYTTPDYPSDAPQEIKDWATNNVGITIFYATNTQIPNSTGNWSVQVFFYAPGGHLIGQRTDIVAIRATSFNVIPDIPVLGSAGALTAMLLSLGLFLYRKRASIKTTTF